MRKIIKFTFFLITFLLALPSWGRDPFLLPSNPPVLFASIRLQHITAQEAFRSLQKLTSHLLAANEYFAEEIQRNSIVIYATQDKINKIKILLRTLDNPIPRILIQAKIVILDQHCLKELGAIFAAHDTNQTATGLVLPLLSFKNQQILDLKLQALETTGHAHIISTPSLVVNTGHTANIASGEELPYQEQTSEGNTSVTFKNAVLELKVTPTLLADRTINLNLSLHQDKPGERLINGTPAVDTEQIQTITHVAQHETLVLGGIDEDAQNTNRIGIPILSHLPLLGPLFQSHRSEHKERILMIFITPSLI